MALLTPDQARKLQEKGYLDEATASRFTPEPVMTPAAEPMMTPSTYETRAPALAPEPMSERDTYQNEFLSDVGRVKQEQAAADLQQTREMFEQKKADLKQRILADAQGRGFNETYDAFSPPLSEEQIRQKYGAEMESLQAEEKALGDAGLGLTAAVAEPTVDLVDYKPDNRGMIAGNDPYQAGQMAVQQNPLLTAYDQKMANIQQMADAGAAQAAKEGGYMQQVIREQQKFADEQNRKIQEGIEAQQSALVKLQEEQAKLDAEKIDPNRLWNNASTGQKILAGISIGLGALGVGLAGGQGRNQALETITGAINKDIQAQEANLASKKANVKAKEAIVGRMLDTYGDMRMAKAAAEASMLKRAEIDIANMASQYKSQEMQQKAQALIGDIQLKRAEVENSLAQQAAFTQGGQMNLMAMDPKMRESYVPGVGFAYSPKEAGELRAAVPAVQDAKQMIGKLLELSNKPMKSISPTDRKLAESLVAMLKGRSRTEIVGPGAVTEAEYKMLDAVIPNPTAIFSLDNSNKAALKQFSETLDRGLQNKMKNQIINYNPQQMRKPREIDPNLVRVKG